MYRMSLNLNVNPPKLSITDSTPLTYNGGTINARGIAQDTRYPNAYWVSDFGTGNNGTIYRVVGFDLQSLNIITPAYNSILVMGSTASITFSSQRIDTVTLSYSTNDGATWNVIGNTVVQAATVGATTQSTYSWTVPTLAATANKCKIRAIASGGGNNPIQSTSNLFTIENPNAVNEPAVSADGFMLYPSNPDPFQSTATIRFDAPIESEATLKVYDVNGALVQTLFDGVASPGQHVYTFDASGLPSGMYVYRLHTGRQELSRTMLLVR